MSIVGGRLVSLVCLPLLLASCSTPLPERGRETATPPNILVYVVDALRPDVLGCYGNQEVETNAIDTLAREGVLFENAFAQSTWTRPSMATILTGLYPGAHGVLGREHRLSQHLTILPEILREHQYRTAFITTNPNVGSIFGFDQGWDSFQELYERREEGPVRSTELITRSDAVTLAAGDWLDRVTQPFFLLVLAVDPHWPYQPREPFDRYVPEGAGEHARARGLYAGEVAANDEAFGTLLAHLKDRNLYESTIILFTSDHGEEFWEHGERGHGRTLYEESIHVPLVIRSPRPDGPNAMSGGLRIATPVQSVDIAPTLLALAGIPIPSPMDGRPIVAAASESRPVFSRLLHDNQNLATIRDYPWKLIWDRNRDELLLFDLERDPGEERSVTGEHEAVAARLADELFQHAARNLERRASLSESGAETIDEDDVPKDVRERLKALGYVQ